jgi:NUMOD3 motif
MTTFIYVLKEPATQKVRYVGKADFPHSRFCKHLSRARLCLDSRHKALWIRTLLSKGLEPVLEVIDEVPKELWESAEMGYIQLYLDAGCDLVNATPGGDYGPDMRGNTHRRGKPHSAEARQKMSEFQKKQKHSEARRKAQSIRMLGNTHGLGNKAMLGRKRSVESILKQRAKQIGKPIHSEEEKKKRREAFKGAGNPMFGKVPWNKGLKKYVVTSN